MIPVELLEFLYVVKSDGMGELDIANDFARPFM